MQYKTTTTYPLYKVYEDGKVWSLSRKRWLKGSIRPDGYFMYWLMDNKGVAKWVYAHRLVYLTFVSPIPDGYEINHEDGIRTNNHRSNLTLLTHKENIIHSFDVLGRKIYSGDEHWRTGKKLSDEVKAKMSEQKIGAKHPKFKGYYVIDGIRYESCQLAANALNTYPKKIYNDCMNNRNGWYFEPI